MDGFFAGLLDFDGDGQLETTECVAGFAAFASIMDDVELERRESLERAGLDLDDYEDCD